MSSESVVLNCKFNEENSQLPSSLSSPITVGTEMKLNCEGSAPNFDIAKLKAEALNREEHTIKLLKYENQNGSSILTLTSYRVGEHQDVQLLLTDGKEVARTNTISWNVTSVIDPQNPQAAQPFGPFGPWMISWPWWYFLILAALIAASIYTGIRVWKTSKRKLEVRKRINEYRQKFNPFDQFQKTLRSLDREYHASLVRTPEVPRDYVGELQKSSITYLMMEFEQDFENRSPRFIVRKLRRGYPKAKDSVLNDLALYLTEFNKKADKPEIEKLIEWAGRVSEKVDRQSFGAKK